MNLRVLYIKSYNQFSIPYNRNNKSEVTKIINFIYGKYHCFLLKPPLYFLGIQNTLHDSTVNVNIEYVLALQCYKQVIEGPFEASSPNDDCNNALAQILGLV